MENKVQQLSDCMSPTQLNCLYQFMKEDWFFAKALAMYCQDNNKITAMTRILTWWLSKSSPNLSRI
jgi:hypothetical protein